MPKNITPISEGTRWYDLKMAAKGRASIEVRGTIGWSKEYREWGMDAAGTVLEFERELKELGDVSVIDLYIYSLGGYVWDALAIHDILVRHPARIEAHVDGLAASAATILLMAADTVEVPANAYLMIHNAGGCVCGDHRDMKKAADMLAKFSRDIANLYVSRIEDSSASNEGFNRAATLTKILQMMDDETWLTGEEAVALGLADTASSAVEIAADASGIFANAAWQRTVNIERVPESLRPLFDSRPGMNAFESNPTPSPVATMSDPAPASVVAAPVVAPTAQVDPAPAPVPAPQPAPVAQVDPAPVPAPAPTVVAPVAEQVTMAGIATLINGAITPLQTEITNLKTQVDHEKALREAGVNPTAWGGNQPPVNNPVNGEPGSTPTDLATLNPTQCMKMGLKKFKEKAA